MMSQEAAPQVEPGRGADAAFVEAFLRANPAWLAEHPELYRVLDAAGARAWRRRGRSHGGDAAGPARARRRAAGGRARDRAASPARVQEAVLALLRSADPADCVSDEMPGLLAVDAAHLCVEAEHPGARRLPTGTVARLLDGRQVVFRDAPSDARLLHAEAAGLARHDALVRVPGEGPPALLALLARDRHLLDPRAGSRSPWFPRPRRGRRTRPLTR